MDAERVTASLVDELRHIPGVAAIVLGGSRARGTETAHSDVDLGLYYRTDEPLDLAALRQLAARVDDGHQQDVLTEIGGWGPWINGGGWLKVQAIPVDLLYRDLEAVAAVMDTCLAGRIEIAYQPGHPHGFVSAIYLAEIALCKVLWDPSGVIGALKARTAPYPLALKTTLIQRFLWEAAFSLQVAHKGVARRDVAYVAGCCFRSVACLLQTLFAVNECYWLNEKGAVALAETFAKRPTRLAARIEEAFARLSASEDDLIAALHILEGLVAETQTLLS